MAFGERMRVGVRDTTFGVDMPVAQSQAPKPSRNDTSEAVGRRFVRSSCSLPAAPCFTAFLPAMLRTSFGTSARRNLATGLWFAGHKGKCERTNFVITRCSVKIQSVARPDQAPTAHFLDALFGRWREALVPVRSTADRGAVSIFYAAETKLWNRSLSFVFSTGILALFCCRCAARFLESGQFLLTENATLH